MARMLGIDVCSLLISIYDCFMLIRERPCALQEPEARIVFGMMGSSLLRVRTMGRYYIFSCESRSDFYSRKDSRQLQVGLTKGSSLSRLAALFAATGDASLLDQAEITLAAAISDLTVNDILKESCNDTVAVWDREIVPSNENRRSLL